MVRLDNARRTRSGKAPRQPSGVTSDLRPKAPDAPARDERAEVHDTERSPRPTPTSERVSSTSEAPRGRKRQITPHASAMPALASQAVDELMTQAPISIATIMPRIERLLDHATPLLVERFPGPLWSDSRRAASEEKRGEEISGIAACFVALGERGLPSIVRLMASERSVQRCAAAYVAGELPWAASVEALAQAALHPDPSTRLAALVALARHSEVRHDPHARDSGMRDVASSYAGVVARLRKSASFAATLDVRLWSIQALEELRDPGCVPMLVAFLHGPDDEVADAARAALVTLTARSLGRLRWRVWLRANADRPRFLWLTAALRQWNAALRTVASVELVRMTGHGRALLAGSTRAEARGLEAYYLECWAEKMQHLGEVQP